MFKKGDRVVYNERCRRGQSGTVTGTSADGTATTVKWDTDGKTVSHASHCLGLLHKQPTEPEYQFKEGDRVRYTGNCGQMDKWMVGRTGTVEYQDRISNVAVDWDTSAPCPAGVFPGNLELIKEEQVMFKAGDKVRIKQGLTTLKEGTWGLRTPIGGKEGVVARKQGNLYVPETITRIDFPECAGWAVRNSELELVTEFKVGDKVRVKRGIEKPSGGWGDVTKDSVGEVVNTNNRTNNLITVNFPEQIGWVTIPEHLELVESAPESAQSGIKPVYKLVCIQNCGQADERYVSTWMKPEYGGIGRPGKEVEYKLDCLAESPLTEHGEQCGLFCYESPDSLIQNSDNLKALSYSTKDSLPRAVLECYPVGEKTKKTAHGSVNYPAVFVVEELWREPSARPVFPSTKVWKDVTMDCGIDLHTHEDKHLLRVRHGDFTCHFGIGSKERPLGIGEDYRITKVYETSDGSGWWFRIEHLEEE